MLAGADVERLELAEVLLTTGTTALEVTELENELWLAEVLSDETLEKLTKLLIDEDDAEGLTLNEKPWMLLDARLVAVWLDKEEETTAL